MLTNYTCSVSFMSKSMITSAEKYYKVCCSRIRHNTKYFIINEGKLLRD